MSKAWLWSLRTLQTSTGEKHLNKCQCNMVSSGHEDAQTARQIYRTGTTTGLKPAEKCHRRHVTEVYNEQEEYKVHIRQFKRGSQKYEKRCIGRLTCMAERYKGKKSQEMR